MDYFLSSHKTAIAAILAVFPYSLLLAIIRNLLRNRSKKNAAPEAGGAWPLIGHLHLLRGPKPPHRVLSNMADKYGPIFTVKMGVHQALVVSNWEIAKECLTTHDQIFANRPKAMAMELLGYNFAMIRASAHMAPTGVKYARY
ncbi:hypothetical protein Patl1_09060 [Pistacia atlantica]|uniref:Uncharacterized protein n=1 Tax=Pistacia atlantica TaxID=434234 RepID=A0ACC1AHE8_9ROSI|nr:hypothetical protein Patl1_09060 [Pistacia atlantica]